MPAIQFLKLYAATATVFLALDLAWLGVVARGFYRAQMGHLMRSDAQWGPALLFYGIYVAAIIVLCVRPGLERESMGRAVAMGRVHHQYLPDVLQVDRWGLEAATRRALQAKGHVIKEVDPWGDGEAVMVDPKTGLRTAGSDPRNEGTALGER